MQFVGGIERPKEEEGDILMRERGSEGHESGPHSSSTALLGERGDRVLASMSSAGFEEIAKDRPLIRVGATTTEGRKE
jgi:hypothetical protein